MRKTLGIIFLVLALIGLSFLIIKKSEEVTNSSQTEITTSFYPMYFFANEISGGKIDVVNITPPGTEPHDYDLTSQDIIKIENSKLLILNGIIEPWAGKITDDLKTKNTQIVVAGKNLTTNNDPHIWLSPRLAKLEAETIATAMENADPGNASSYKTNEMSLEKKLTDLDKSYKTGLENCSSRSFVTSHAAFTYLANDYNLNQIAIDGLSPDAEPSLSKLAEITNFVKANNVKYIFFESLVSPKLSETIANEVGAQTLVLDPIEGVTKDNLAKGTNYLTLMTANLQNLRKALQCE